jgi:ferric-dicitrate binding protein FerR (iron transport regulator)
MSTPADRELLESVEALLDRSSGADPTAEEVAAGRAKFVDRASRIPSAFASMRPRRMRQWLIPIAAALVTVVIGLFVMNRRPTPITFRVDGGGPPLTAGFVRSAADAEATIDFTDGSSIVLARGASGRVNEVSTRGARFSVEQGHISVHVAKREGGADYVVEAGPYRVKVTGTRFMVDWDPARQHMLLAVTEGAVVVTGPTAEEGITVRVGDSIDIGPRESAVAPSSPQQLRPAPSPSASSVAVAPIESASDHPKEDLAPKLSWSARIAKGDFAGVLADAEARGIEATLSSGSIDDLMALADAARYGGKSGVAMQVLEAVRKRFPGSQPASTAAFLLARAAEDSGNSGRAISLYDATMSEGGAFAAEALGRKMLLVQRSSGDAAAAPIAREYLHAYPKGPYAGAAKAIAGN